MAVKKRPRRGPIFFLYGKLDAIRLPVAGFFMVAGIAGAIYSLVRIMPGHWLWMEGFSEARIAALVGWAALAFLGVQEIRDDLQEDYEAG